MPTHKVKGGYQWGKHGKIYPTKKQADKQGQAIYASGWKENKTNENMKQNKKLIRLTESDLYNIIKESINKIYKEKDNLKKIINHPSQDLQQLINICEEYKLNKIRLFFDKFEIKILKNILGKKIKYNNESNYVAEFIIPNNGFGDNYACVLSVLEFSGYGVSKNYICEISYDEFCKLLNYFYFDGNQWVKK
jgi:hypothetical protein